MIKLPAEYFQRDAVELAPELLGKYLIRKFDDNSVKRYKITELEVYRGEEDKACHASKGRTARTEVLYHSGGRLYIYLIYGIHWMLNIVTGKENHPQAILIRGVDDIFGPGRVTKLLGIDKSFNDIIIPSNDIWVGSDGTPSPPYITTPRIGIDYAQEWKDVPWRYLIKS